GFWEEAARTAVYLRNRSPTKALPNHMTPYEALKSVKPSLNHLRRFGCKAYAVVHPTLRTKWRPRVTPCMHVGYNDYTTKQYRVWDGRRILIVASTNLKFDEQTIAKLSVDTD